MTPLEPRKPLRFRTVGRPKEGLTLALQDLAVGERLLLPFEKRTASTSHTRAARLGMKITTRTVIKFESNWIQLRRVA